MEVEHSRRRSPQRRRNPQGGGAHEHDQMEARHNEDQMEAQQHERLEGSVQKGMMCLRSACFYSLKVDFWTACRVSMYFLCFCMPVSVQGLISESVFASDRFPGRLPHLRFLRAGCPA